MMTLHKILSNILYHVHVCYLSTDWATSILMFAFLQLKWVLDNYHAWGMYTLIGQFTPIDMVEFECRVKFKTMGYTKATCMLILPMCMVRGRKGRAILMQTYMSECYQMSSSPISI